MAFDETSTFTISDAAPPASAQPQSAPEAPKAADIPKVAPPPSRRNMWSVVFLVLVATIASIVLFILQRNSDEVFLQDTKDLFSTPAPNANKISAQQCLRIKWYKVDGDVTLPTSWLELTDADIAALYPGEIVYVTVMGKPVEGGRTYTQARIRSVSNGIAHPFQINDVTSLKKPKITPKDLDEFYILYSIPSTNGPQTVTFDAQVYSPQRDTNGNALDADIGWE